MTFRGTNIVTRRTQRTGFVLLLGLLGLASALDSSSSSSAASSSSQLADSDQPEGASVAATPAVFQCPVVQAPSAFPASCKLKVCSSKVRTDVPTLAADLNPLRKAFIEMARCYIGQVNVCLFPGGQKYGADVLVDIYKTAFAKTPLPASALRLAATKRGQWNGPWSWCGVFTAAMAIKAGINTWWIAGKGLQNLGRQKGGSKGMQVGDVVVFKGGSQHHAIVEAFPGNGVVITLDGNAMCEGIYRNARFMKDVQGYYTTVA